MNRIQIVIVLLEVVYLGLDELNCFLGGSLLYVLLILLEDYACFLLLFSRVADNRLTLLFILFEQLIE